MKHKLLLLFSIATTTIWAQSHNSCSDADNNQITTEGTYSITGFDGDTTPVSCTDGSPANKAEWFAYTPSSDFQVTVSSDIEGNGGKDTRLQIFNGSCGSLTCVGGSDDDGVAVYSRLSVVTFNATAGTTYYIAWDNKYSSSAFDFIIAENPIQDISFTQGESVPGTFRGVVDMNNDGLDDVVSIITRTVNPDTNPYYTYDLHIKHQTNSGTFTDTEYLLDAPYSAGWSLAAGDFNGDNYTDIVFGNGSGLNIVKAENNGTSYSVLLSKDDVFTQRTNFVDINEDGHLDVFVCHDIAPNVYFINDGSGNFTFYQGGDPNGVPEGLGVYPSGGNYGSVWIDYDNDRDMDMFLAKCGGGEERRTNQLFRNNGNGSYTEVAASAGLADPIQTWSGAWGDYDNDGDMDVFIGGYNGASHKMMRNNGNGTFTDITATTGLAGFSPTGIDNVPADFNNDGFIDIFSNGNILLNNQDPNNMSFSIHSSGMPAHGGVGDLNNDGYLDVSNSKIYYNDGGTNNYFKIRLQGGQNNTQAIGARVEIVSDGIGKQIRDIRSGEGFKYMGSLTAHFGLGTDTSITSVTVYWPNGVVDVINNPSINQAITLTPGATLGTQQQEFASDLVLHPNPVKKFLYIKTKQSLTDAIYTVFDVSGKRVMNGKLSSKKMLDVSSLNTGAYFLRIMNDNASKTEKFIKE